MASLTKTDVPTDIIIICDDEVFQAHSIIICEQSALVQEICDKTPEVSYEDLTLSLANLGLSTDAGTDQQKAAGVKAFIKDESFGADTMRCMLEFLYKKDYTTPNEKPTKAQILPHLSCYDIGKHYKVDELSNLALEKLIAGLKVIAVTDFIDLISMFTNNAKGAEAEYIHSALASVAKERVHQLAASSTFLDLIANSPSTKISRLATDLLSEASQDCIKEAFAKRQWEQKLIQGLKDRRSQLDESKESFCKLEQALTETKSYVMELKKQYGVDSDDCQ